MGVGGVAGVLGLVNIPSKQKPPHIQHTVDTRAANAPSVFTITEMAPTRATSWLKEPTSGHYYDTKLNGC